MASEGGILEGSSSTESVQSSRTVALQVLSPSLPPPNRITFDNLPLTITIADLKSRIAERIPHRHSPEKQRLIYRGKPLSDDRAVLQDIFESSEVSPAHDVHFVMRPQADHFESRRLFIQSILFSLPLTHLPRLVAFLRFLARWSKNSWTPQVMPIFYNRLMRLKLRINPVKIIFDSEAHSTLPLSLTSRVLK